jgi:hypothetical protein
VTDNFITELLAGAITVGSMDESHVKNGANKNIRTENDEMTDG